MRPALGNVLTVRADPFALYFVPCCRDVYSRPHKDRSRNRPRYAVCHGPIAARVLRDRVGWARALWFRQPLAAARCQQAGGLISFPSERVLFDDIPSERHANENGALCEPRFIPRGLGVKVARRYSFGFCIRSTTRQPGLASS